MNATSERFPLTSRQSAYGTSPSTPNSNDNGFMAAVNRSFSMENLPRQAMMSAPSSRHPSRPGSAGSNRNSLSADSNTGQPVGNQVFANQSRRPPPLIHKLVPAEGSITGGTEVTLLGNGFYQGLEVMFGDTEATTTTFWGEKCLNCITPPAIQAGSVAVVFKYEHHQYSSMQHQSQSRHTFFNYLDDREVEMYRLALKTVGKQMQHPTEDPYSAAQQLLRGPSPSFWPSTQGGYGGGGVNQRQAQYSAPGAINLAVLESNMLTFLDHLDLGGIARPSRLNTIRHTGVTLLHLASSLGLTRFVAGLLSRGANPDAMDKNGNTPLHLATMNGHLNIIHRLRLAGADHKLRSIRGFIPADLALSLRTHQDALTPQQRRTASRTRSRRANATSLEWDADHVLNDSEDSDVEVVNHRPPTPLPTSSDEGKVIDVPPALHLSAWRDSLAAQIQHYHDSASWMMPNPNLPVLPNLPDYQAHSMVRQVNSLLPHRPSHLESSSSPGPAPPKAPPAYNELYPHQAKGSDLSIKKASTLQAAVGAALDRHFDAVESSDRSERDMKAMAAGRRQVSSNKSARGWGRTAAHRYLFFVLVSELS